MPWLEWLKKFLRRNPATIAVSILGLLLVVADKIDKLDYVGKALEPVVQAAVHPTADRPFHLAIWFALSEYLVIGLALLGIALWVRSKMGLEDPAQTLGLQETQKHIESLEHALQTAMASTSRIKNQLMPTKLKPKRQLLTIENTYVIRKNFDTEVTRRFQMKAAQAPIHFWECIIQVSDAECEAVKYLEAIDFKVVDENRSSAKTDVVYLPLRNDPFSKEVLVYFLPQIDPAEAAPRTVAVTYKWPGMSNELKAKRRDEWGWIVESETPVQDVVFRFLTEDLGGKLEMRISGSQDGMQSIVDAGKNPAGLNQMEYRIKDAPSGRYSVELLLK
jgi:hypothetical protein